MCGNITRQDPPEIEPVRRCVELLGQFEMRSRDRLYASVLEMFDLGWRYGRESQNELNDEQDKATVGGMARAIASYLQKRTSTAVDVEWRIQSER